MESAPTISAVPRGEEWLSVPQVADRLGLTQASVRALIERGELAADFVLPYPGPRTRRRAIRIRHRDVEGFLERARVKPGELRHLHPNW